MTNSSFPFQGSGFAYERSKASSDSEQIEHTVARQHVRNSVSVENERAKSASGSVLVYCERCDKQIQDKARMGLKSFASLKMTILTNLLTDLLPYVNSLVP